MKKFLVIIGRPATGSKNFVIQSVRLSSLDNVVRVIKNPERVLKIDRSKYKANASFYNMIDLSTFDYDVETILNDKELLDNIDVYVDDFTIRYAIGKDNVKDYSLIDLQTEYVLKETKDRIDKIKNSSSLTDVINKSFNIEKKILLYY